MDGKTRDALRARGLRTLCARLRQVPHDLGSSHCPGGVSSPEIVASSYPSSKIRYSHGMALSRRSFLKTTGAVLATPAILGPKQMPL